jgi:signal transduction histidine kinase
VPIVVEGRIWGVAVVMSAEPEPLPAEAEARMAGFTELVATAIANADSHAQLTASRARIVAAGDNARRRIEQDLHDGAQQRLIALGLQVRVMESSVPAGLGTIRQQLSQVANGLNRAFQDLQEIARGIHPAILSKGGLGPAIKTLARRSPTPVDLALSIDRRLPEPVAVGAYYIVSEALTNAAKHARATLVRIDVKAEDATLRLSIRDNGIGGADARKGSGLIGLQDRIETLGGHLDVTSPAGHGTALLVSIPIHDTSATAARRPVEG